MVKLLSPIGWIKFLYRGTIALLLVLGWAIAACAVHVVVVPAEEDASWRVLLVPKPRLGLAQTYVDTRGWSPAEAAEPQNAALLARLAEAGKGDRVETLLREAIVRRAIERVREGAAVVTGGGDQAPVTRSR